MIRTRFRIVLLYHYALLVSVFLSFSFFSYLTGARCNYLTIVADTYTFADASHTDQAALALGDSPAG